VCLRRKPNPVRIRGGKENRTGGGVQKTGVPKNKRRRPITRATQFNQTEKKYKIKHNSLMFDNPWRRGD